MMDIILDLPKVKKESKYVRTVTKGKRQLFDYIAGRPDADGNYYTVLVAEDNGWSTHFIFIVDARNYKIKYYDTASGEYFSLNAWRKCRSKSN